MKISNVQEQAVKLLVPFAGNARTHPEQQILELCESIKKFGFYNPVLVDASGIIIAGHGRVMAAERLGMKTVPTLVFEGLTDAERRALTLADNKISLNASWDLVKLREELSELAKLDFDLELTGFKDYEIDAMLRDDGDILPRDIESNFIPVTEQPKPSPTPTVIAPTVEPSEQSYNPKVSDDDYSRFDLVMTHSNKVELIELLSKIRADQMYDKLEDALMDIVKFWKENK